MYTIQLPLQRELEIVLRTLPLYREHLYEPRFSVSERQRLHLADASLRTWVKRCSRG